MNCAGTKETIGTMVVCLKCKKVVWAYDANMGDVRGLLNMMRIPCRLCGIEGNFDGWRVGIEDIERLGAWDAWNAMHKIAGANGFVWEASDNNTWFKHSSQNDMPDDIEAYRNEKAEEMP